MAKTQETLNQSAKQPAEPPTVEYSAPEFDHQSATERPKYSVSISRNVLVVAAVIVGLGLSFIAGAQFQKHNGFDDEDAVRTSAMGANGAYGMGGRNGARRMGGAGTVTAVSNSSITIAFRSFGPNSNSSGTSKTYVINDSTKVIVDGSTGSVSDIKTGDMVFVRTSSSTSTTATEIRVGGMGAPGAPSSSSQTDSPSSSDSSAI